MNKIFLLPFIVLGIIVASFLIIHLLAFLGVFLAFAYPIWWLLLPHTTPCILCHAYPEGSRCPLCKEPVSKQNIHPKTISSALKNALLILLLSLLSIGLVYLETKTLNYLGIPPTEQTVSIVIPPKGQYKLDEIFPLPIELIGIKTPINAVQVDLSFDPRLLRVHEISTKDSFANIFIQKEINNDQGYARLTGGLPNPGYFADHGLFGTVYFQGLQPGIATIDYLSTSMVLANDGRGTNVLKGLSPVNYLILTERLSDQQSSDQQVIFNTKVLGASINDDQLTFYSEDVPSVLGTSAQAISQEDLSEIRDDAEHSVLLNLLAKICDFILRFWHNILEFLESIFR